MPQSRSTATAFAMALLLAGPWTADRASADDAVRLIFDWPQTVSGRATLTFEFEEEIQDWQTRLNATGRYGFLVRPSAGLRLVEFGDASFEVISASASLESRLIAPLVTLALTQRPDFFMGEAGDFRGIADGDAYYRAYQVDLTAVLAQASSVTAPWSTTVPEQEIMAMAKQWWSREVGRWTDLLLEPGDTIIGEELMSTPIAGQVTAEVTRRLVGRAPCEAPNGCVELEFRRVVDSAEALAAFESEARKLDADMRAESYRVDFAIRLVTDPDTLLPYRTRVVTSREIEWQSKGVPDAIRETSTLEVTYDYD